MKLRVHQFDTGHNFYVQELKRKKWRRVRIKEPGGLFFCHFIYARTAEQAIKLAQQYRKSKCLSGISMVRKWDTPGGYVYKFKVKGFYNTVSTIESALEILNRKYHPTWHPVP